MESLVAIVCLAISGIFSIAYYFKSRQANTFQSELLKKSNELSLVVLNQELKEISKQAEDAKEKHETASDRYHDYVKRHLSDDDSKS